MTTEAYGTTRHKYRRVNTPQGGAIEGNAADDALLVDQGRSIPLLDVTGCFDMMINSKPGYELLEPKDSRWYAVHSRSHFEQKVYDGLCKKSIEAFLPRIQVMSQRRDRRKKILVPMLPGYVFVRSDMHPEEYHHIIKTVGIVRIVSFKGTPVPANEEEISSLMILDNTDRTVQNRSYIEKGDRVMIMEGPLKGIMGFYLRHRGKSDRVVVSVELLRRSLAVEVEDWALEKLP